MGEKRLLATFTWTQYFKCCPESEKQNNILSKMFTFQMKINIELTFLLTCSPAYLEQCTVLTVCHKQEAMCCKVL